MKQIVAILLTAAIGFFVFTGLYTEESGAFKFTQYGNADVQQRVSDSYIRKNVTENNTQVVFGESKDLESGSANYVTSIVVNYRSFDTLGEITVLFIAAFGVGLLLSGNRKRLSSEYEPNFILRYGARFVFGIMVIFGVYMFSHGHLTPGGGFPGGSIIAAAMLLLYLADNEFREKVAAVKVTEGLAGSAYVIVGLLGLALGGYFLSNFLPTGTVGTLISAGIVPIVYILIGLKVGSELSTVVDSFLTQEVQG